MEAKQKRSTTPRMHKQAIRNAANKAAKEYMHIYSDTQEHPTSHQEAYQKPNYVTYLGGKLDQDK